MNESEAQRAIERKDKTDIHSEKKSNKTVLAMTLGILNALGVNISDAFVQAENEVTNKN